MPVKADNYLWPEDDRKPQMQIRRIPNVVAVKGGDGKPVMELGPDGKPRRVTKTTGFAWLVTVPTKISGGRRERYQFKDEDEHKAKEKAEQLSAEKTDLGKAAFELKPAERRDAATIYIAARDLIPDGAILNVLTDAAAGIKVLEGRKVTLEAVAKFYVDRQPKQDKTVPDVVAEFVALRTKRTKKGTPASAKYLADLGRLEKFGNDFQFPIAAVEPGQIDAWTDKKGLTGRTRHNYLRLIRTLFRYAQAKQYFPRTVNPLEGVDGVDSYTDTSAIEIFSPAELRMLLQHARSELVPFLTISAFAGLRHAELVRLDWKEVNGKHIAVTADKAKTASRRLVPIQPCLAEWLAPHRQESGPVVKFANVSKQLMWLADNVNAAMQKEKAGSKFAWKHNALRHSFISYRVAQTQNVDQVALEAGNSRKMIDRNYRELVTGEQANDWFGIIPAQTKSNIVPMIAVV